MKNAPLRSFLTLGLGLAAISAPAPANAQGYGSAAYSAKTSAILGGFPSRLAMITAQQQGTPFAATVQAAAFSLPSLRPAVLDRYQPLRPMPERLQVQRSEPWTGRPDLFGSVALKVKRTPLDHRWIKVAGAHLPASANAASRALRGLAAADRVETVNRYVNSRVEFVDDRRQFGQADLWSAASATLRRGRGDCEDYALAKMQMLRAAGIPSKDLYFVIVRDLVRMADHAVLVVRADGRNLMLDNSTDTVLDADTVRDYRPIFTFASTGSWTHGYRRQRKPSVEWASAAAATPASFGF